MSSNSDSKFPTSFKMYNMEEAWQALDKLRASPRKRQTTLIALAIGLILLISQLSSGFGSSRSYPSTWRDSRDVVRRKDWSLTSDFDIVVSHYDEDINIMRESIATVKSHLPKHKKHRVIIYTKKERDHAGKMELLDMADEVVTIPNVGREGETYLSHIVRHYETPATNLAEHTIFMQPHVAWDWVFVPRLRDVLKPATGFLSFGPYITQQCGKDSHGMEFPRMNDIYVMFRSDFCPPEPVLATWAGQFVVSRRRILNNQLLSYQNLKAKFHAPPEHWIWKEGWHNNEPSNPTLGHALERTWPVVFGCTDANIEAACGGEGATNVCQCLDR
ncbi:hypothetical protein CI109_100038 [Kwoniella shandongensis]|uniref:Uncharacterized protein n=1 Tax=Kwoniella shandongensis TaxID=1734106 RepID=A0A5M6BTZ8_9TREE|nr:uncharacterized protein CI109_005989 [Kwoniella shandongensis]KAA5525681.1 hypothetical protein CI109_005989 [Kwoniella shandongensis]